MFYHTMKPPTNKKTPFASIWIYNPPHLPGEAKRRGSWPVLGHPLIPRAPSCTLRSPASLRNLVATTSGGGISEGSLRWRWWRFFEIWEVVGWTLISRVLGFNVIWCFFFVFLIHISGRIPICDYTFQMGWRHQIGGNKWCWWNWSLDGGTKFSL